MWPRSALAPVVAVLVALAGVGGGRVLRVGDVVVRVDEARRDARRWDSSIVVAPAACAEQSQATQVMLPLPSTTTWPPRKTSPGKSTVPVIDLAALPAVT